MSKSTQINGLPSCPATSTPTNHSIGSVRSSPSSGNLTAAMDCTPSTTNAAAAASKEHLGVRERSNAGGNASSAPGPGGTNSSPDVEAMREWW